MANKTGKGGFQKGEDPRRNRKGQRNREAVAFARTLRELIVKEGEKSVTDSDGKRRKKIENVVQVMYDKAMLGEAWAVQMIFERTEGKVAQPNTNLNLDMSNLTMEQLERISKGEDVSTVLATSGQSGD